MQSSPLPPIIVSSPPNPRIRSFPLVPTRLLLLPSPSITLYADIGLPQKKSAGVGAGVGSQASPIPSPSVSFWSALAVVGQLPAPLGTPSPSISGSHASPIPSKSVSVWSVLAVLGQLSSAFGIPSPSVSGSTQVRSVGSQNGVANAK